MDNKKIILYAVIGIILLLLVLNSFGVIRFGGNRRGTESNGGNMVSENIPEKCRLPAGQDVNSWREHLGHHAETKECLNYFK